MDFCYDSEELLINGQRLQDFLTTVDLKIADLEYQLQNQQFRIDALEADNTSVENKLNEQNMINNDFRDIINYVMNAELFYQMAFNFSKKVSFNSDVDGEHLINNASMVACTVSNTVSYEQEAYSLDYWSLIFDKAIELGIDKDVLHEKLKNFSKSIARYSAHTISGYDINKKHTKLSSFLQGRFNYYDICNLLKSNNRDENCLGQIILSALCPYYRSEYVNYVFKQWDTVTIVKHWQYINISKCSCFKEAYFNNIYDIISKKKGDHYDLIKDDHKLMRSLRNESSRIDNYFKLKNQ